IMNKIKLFFITSFSFLFFTGVVLFRLFKPVSVKISGAIIIFLTVLAIVFFTGRGRYFPLPGAWKRFININIFLALGGVLGRLFGFKEDEVRGFFIDINNSLVGPGGKPAGKILLLLPRCLQNSKCIQDLSQDVSNCIACGKCQVPEILERTKAKDIKVVLAGGGRQALEEINKYDPDSIIAVACEAELTDGIRAVTDKPVWAIRNERPEGPCKNTRVDIKYIKDLL
ncbi:MAG: DUF116 domain-containing protein, partial [Elusimicrobia bacterium]|nr:DUF116 domain-containing protein [Elusimicrobiota bacterium]